MEQVVTLEGAQKLTGTKLEQRGIAPGASGQPVPVLPLDGRSVVYTVLDHDTVIVAGVGENFAPNLPAVLNDDPSDTAQATMVMLSGNTQKSAPFLAILFLHSAAPSKLERVTFRAKGHAHPYTVKYGPVEFDTFAKLVTDAAPQSETSVVDKLIDVLFSGKTEAKSQQLAAKLVGHVARRDGFVEMIGQFDEGDIYVQGWSKELPAGNNRVFVFDGSLNVADFSCCLFERKDTGGKAAGFSGILDPGEPLATSSIRNLFFRGRSGWNKVDVHDKRTISTARALPGQIRALLPRLGVAGDGRSRLETAAQRFDGRETVSELDVPVRVGIDFCAATNTGEVILCGWLLNPEDHVDAVHLRAGNTFARLDETWTSLNRPDVTKAFEDLSPFLRGAGGQNRHGFLVCVGELDTCLKEKPYLEIVLKDGRSAYAPLALGQTTLRSALRRLVAGLDPAVASETDIIERQFLPILGTAVSPEPSVADFLDIGAVPETASRSIVVGLDGAVEKIRTLLPILALDPFLRGTPIVLSASSSVLSEQLQEIKRIATLYGMAVRTVAARNVEDKLDALQAGMETAPSDMVVCLNSSVVPLVPGWLEPLVSAYQEREGSCLVTPTILYEDDTIRWAGTWIDKEGGSHVLKQHYVGYPRRTLLGAESCEVVASTFDCCVLPKSALPESGGFARSYLGTDEKGMDATLKLRRWGLKSYWVPQVEMVHPEDGRGSERLWNKIVGQHDRSQFERTWTTSFAGLKETS
ncbi:hypothetical protein [Roseibium album]|uniref:hypothetical protein n=1 Tax=Roseibium album TaxID=311410 RepID=UPI00249389C2|nr:hypothetical protein [Roseibium album]